MSGISSYELRVPTYTTLGMFNQANAVAQLQIPQVPNSWLDPSTSFISGEIEITVQIKEDYTPVNGNAFLLGSGGWSMFNRLQTYFNSGVLLEDLQNPNIYVNAWRNLTQNRADKVGDSLVFAGQDQINSTNGANVGYFVGGLGCYKFDSIPAKTGGGAGNNAGAAKQKIKFAIPLCGYLGAQSAGHLIPMFVGPHRIDLSLAQVTDWLVITNATAITAYTGFTFNRLEFVGQIVKLTDPMQELILSSLPTGGQITIRSNQVSTTTVILPSTSSGSVQLLVGTRVSSCKAMLCTYNPTTGVGDGIFGSVNPSAQAISHEINGTFFPQQLQTFDKAPDAFARILQCLGVFSSTGDKPSIALNEWCVGQKTASPSAPFRAPTSTAADLLTNPSNCFYTLMDLEMFGSKGSGSGFFSGQNTTSGSNFLRIQFVEALVNATTVYCFTIHDALITYDVAAQTAVRRI